MKYKEIEEILKAVQHISGEKNREKVFQLMLNAKKKSSDERDQDKVCIVEKQIGKTLLLKFTKQEIAKMPIRFRREFLIEGRVVHCRKRKSGRNTYNYVLRYRRNGFDITASSNDLEEARRKFIDEMKSADRGEPVVKVEKMKSGVPTNFDAFSMYYFENYRKRKVSQITYENDMYRYKNHLKNVFGELELNEILPKQIQEFLDAYDNKGQNKTNRELYSLLNGIFKMAMAHKIIDNNPMAVVIVAKRKSKHGKALTKAEEKILLNGVKGTRYELVMALSLYTGLRPNEIYTARVEGRFIIAKNSKRKTEEIEYKKIPILSMLKPYLKGVKEFKFPTLEYIRGKFNELLPNHIFYDLRTTFYTRCEECGVAEPARDAFVGHSRGELNNTYSDLSDEYLLREGKKLVW